MSEARLLYNHIVDSLTDKQVRDVIRTHVDELEQQNKKLMESQKQKQIIRLCNRLDKAEQQNKQMLEALIDIYNERDPEYYDAEKMKLLIEFVTGKKIEEVTE